MKRLIFCLASGLLLASSAQAQLGVRAGGGVSNFTKSAADLYGSIATNRKLGYQAGIFYQVPLSTHLSLVPEVQFSRERFSVTRRIDFFEGSLSSAYDQSLSYLNLPILLRASVGAFYLEAGPQVSWLLGGRATGTQTLYEAIGFDTSTYPVEAAATTSYHRFDAGPTVGVGVKLPAGLGLGLRAYWGLTKLTADEVYAGFGQTYRGFQHRHTLQASLTYQLAAR
jgi:hypothetical protein